MNSTLAKPVVVVPRCETCNGRFKIKEKIYCGECNVKIHTDCAVKQNECDDLLCISCFKNKRIETALLRNKIITKVVGDDNVRCYIGKSFSNKIHIPKVIIHDECDTDLEVEEIKDAECTMCGWRSEYPESHIDYGNWKCDYIRVNYDLNIEDGNLEWTRKDVPDCAFGYCCENLYNRGCLRHYKELWNCDECLESSGIIQVECGRVDKYGDKCTENRSFNMEFCRECLKILNNEDE